MGRLEGCLAERLSSLAGWSNGETEQMTEGWICDQDRWSGGQPRRWRRDTLLPPAGPPRLDGGATMRSRRKEVSRATSAAKTIEELDGKTSPPSALLQISRRLWVRHCGKSSADAVLSAPN